MTYDVPCLQTETGIRIAIWGDSRHARQTERGKTGGTVWAGSILATKPVCARVSAGHGASQRWVPGLFAGVSQPWTFEIKMDHLQALELNLS